MSDPKPFQQYIKLHFEIFDMLAIFMLFSGIWSLENVVIRVNEQRKYLQLKDKGKEKIAIPGLGYSEEDILKVKKVPGTEGIEAIFFSAENDDLALTFNEKKGDLRLEPYEGSELQTFKLIPSADYPLTAVRIEMQDKCLAYDNSSQILTLLSCHKSDPNQRFNVMPADYNEQSSATEQNNSNSVTKASEISTDAGVAESNNRLESLESNSVNLHVHKNTLAKIKSKIGNALTKKRETVRNKIKSYFKRSKDENKTVPEQNSSEGYAMTDRDQNSANEYNSQGREDLILEKFESLLSKKSQVNQVLNIIIQNWENVDLDENFLRTIEIASNALDRMINVLSNI